MKILILTFYYKPDLCAGSFRNTAFADVLSVAMSSQDNIHLVTTVPNRYKTFQEETLLHEENGNITIDRIQIPLHKSGLIDQTFSFIRYFINALRLVRKKKYDLVYASSSRLFTAFLGAIVSKWKGIPLYLDIRDLFVDTMSEVIKNKIASRLLRLLLLPIEHFTFKSAAHINMVSPGFEAYLVRFKGPKFSFFTNGIDDEFLKERKPQDENTNNTSKKIILYAGNIGEGQGLEKIIPAAAERLRDNFIFWVVGDGGTRHKLEEKIHQSKLDNVVLMPPVNRTKLIELYRKADYLFLHLNNYVAFDKVLPSKIFEYAAFDTPIIAGVSGMARKFMEEKIENILLFDSGNADQLVEKIQKTQYRRVPRENFCTEFSRKMIFDEMVSSLLAIKKS